MPENSYLLGKLLSATGLAAIVGCPDSGKSMFCRELALSIALGKTDFIDMPIHAKHGRAIYVSTEDAEDSTQYSFQQQLKKMGIPNENLSIIFTDQIDTDTLIKDINTLVSENPVDLIVLDSYGDLFTGKDGNANIEVRTFLKPFNMLANRFGCLILFIHHINKSGYFDSPNQKHVQGASALGQKLRLILDLRKGDEENSMRYLTVTKGNAVASELKKRAIELEFDEDTFTFHRTGNEKPLHEFIPKKPLKEERDYSILFESDEKKQKYTELVKRWVIAFKQSEVTAKRMVSKVLDKDADGMYLNPKYHSIMVSQPLENDTMIPDTKKTKKKR